MAHAVADEPILHMGPAVPKGKLAMWIFLSTEIMFFTALIGVYIIFRNGQPTEAEPWPTPPAVHLVEWMGALNTFVLICSSVTVVLAHHALTEANVKRAIQYIFVTFTLGLVFLGIKAVEYQAKFAHGILPGRMFDRLDGRRGPQYLVTIRDQLKHLVEGNPEKKEAAYEGAAQAEVVALYKDVQLKEGRSVITPEAAGKRVHEILEKAEANHEDLHLSPVIPWGNLWASCYFAMTGFHAIHVLGGIVIFAIILIMALRGRFGVQHESMVELTGLYWHFVDIVWIFLFPLLYLV